MSQLDLKSLQERINDAENLEAVEQLRVEILGRHGALTKELRRIGQLPPNERKAAGKAANQSRQQIEDSLSKKHQELQEQLWDQQKTAIDLDVTAPADTPDGYGHSHPVQEIIADIVRVFWQMGYQVVEGPEIETEWYNFESLNIPANHPARDLQDTFYLEDENLPRTHTSGVQVRFMEQNQPPIRIISPGKVYRNEDEDTRHSWQFYQVEGLVVDQGVTLADLKGTLLAMMRGLLGEKTQVKLLPSFFPYTEPSVELHATCPVCGGDGCKTCGQSGWLELGGAGMVHPQVLRNAGIDPQKYTAFAFGFGPERIAMIKYGVGDVRDFWRPNLNFLEQF